MDGGEGGGQWYVGSGRIGSALFWCGCSAFARPSASSCPSDANPILTFGEQVWMPFPHDGPPHIGPAQNPIARSGPSHKTPAGGPGQRSVQKGMGPSFASAQRTPPGPDSGRRDHRLPTVTPPKLCAPIFFGNFGHRHFCVQRWGGLCIVGGDGGRWRAAVSQSVWVPSRVHVCICRNAPFCFVVWYGRPSQHADWRGAGRWRGRWSGAK